MGVLAFSFGSHKNFNRPLSETPALSHPELFSGWNIKWNKKWDCLSLPTETSCCALNATPTHPTLLLVSFVLYKKYIYESLLNDATKEMPGICHQHMTSVSISTCSKHWLYVWRNYRILNHASACTQFFF